MRMFVQSCMLVSCMHVAQFSHREAFGNDLWSVIGTSLAVNVGYVNTLSYLNTSILVCKVPLITVQITDQVS